MTNKICGLTVAFVIAVTLWCGICYLLGSFVQADFNIVRWDEGMRMFVGTLMGLGVIGAMMAVSTMFGGR